MLTFAGIGSTAPAQTRPPRDVIYLATSTLENARDLLLNAGCVTTWDEVRAEADKRQEAVFRVTIERL